MQDEKKSKFISKVEVTANELLDLVKETKGASILLLVTEADFDGKTQNIMAWDGAVNQTISSLVEFGLNPQSSALFGAAVETCIARRAFAQVQQAQEVQEAQPSAEVVNDKPTPKNGKK
jgi:hypothetical protein